MNDSVNSSCHFPVIAADVLMCNEHSFSSFALRIDKGSPGGGLYLGTCIRNYDNCQGILYIVKKIIFFSSQ